MSVEENKAVILRYFNTGSSPETLKRIQEAKDPAPEVEKFFRSHFGSIFSDSYIGHDTTGDFNKEQALQENLALMAAFRPVRFGIDKTIAEGDLVTVIGKMTGTHGGAYRGTPATGKRVELKYAVVYRVAEGKVAEAWSYMDWLGLMQQIGAIPSGPPPK